MKFSLRTLIAVVFIAAFALMALNGYYSVVRTERQIEPLKYEISILNKELGTSHSEQRQILLNALEDRDSLHAVYEEVLANYPIIRDRNHQMVARSADTFSIKRMPAPGMLPTNFVIEYKMIVPATRPVWVRFGTHASAKQIKDGISFDRSYDWLQSSILSNSGPFERQIPSGEHVLTIREHDHRERREISITLDGEPIFSTHYSDAASDPTRDHHRLPSQDDYSREQSLPHLFTSTILTNAPKFASTSVSYSIWLSDTPDHLRFLKSEMP